MWRTLLLALVAALFLSSCDGDDPKTPDPVPSIGAVSAPSFLLCNTELLYTFNVRVENFGVFDSVVCLVKRPDGSDESPFRLYDDGGSLVLSFPPYAGDNSGDIVSNNNTYTRKIWSNLLCDNEDGEYVFQFQAINGAQRLTGEAFNVEVRAPVACVITGETLPTSFAECFGATNISVTLTEDAEVPIDTVRMSWISGDTLWWEQDMTRGTGGVWNYNLTPAVFQCTPTGSNYTVRFDAYNAFGLSCSHDVHGIAFNNSLPVVSNPQIPDTMYRPVAVGDSNIYQMYVNYDDCELAGLPQTQAAWFQVRREDAPDWPPPGPDFFLRNDGVPPDQIAGDNIASSFLVTKNNGRLDDLYFFRFFAIDCASGDTSDYLIDSTRIIQSGALIGGGGNNNTNDLGISSFK